MAYATGNQLIQRFDVDMVGDLATDDREGLDRSAVATHPNVLTALDDASGEIDVSLQAGGRYTAAQLASLTGNSLSHLVRITCAVAMACLFERRAGEYPEKAEAIAKVARGHLESLRRGENVFGLPEITASGVIDLATPDTIQIDALNLLPSRMARYFPGTAQRQPWGQQ